MRPKYTFQTCKIRERGVVFLPCEPVTARYSDGFGRILDQHGRNKQKKERGIFMKKLASVILAGIIVLGVAGCSDKKETEKTTAATTTTAETTTEETTTAESTTEATTETTTEETTTEAATEETTEATTEETTEAASEETSAESSESTEETTEVASEPEFEGIYTIEASWTGFDGVYPEFSIYEESDEGALGDLITVSKEAENGTGSAQMVIRSLEGKSYILKIDTFDPEDGCNHSFATAKITVKDKDGKEVASFELDKFKTVKGPAGPWAYHVCSISESGVKTLEE